MSKRNPQHGGTLIEFMISLPLMVLIMVGLVSSGRLLHHISTTGQAAFLGGLLVSQANNISDFNAIPARVHKILCMQDRKHKNVDCTNPTAPPVGLITTTPPAAGATGYDRRVFKIAVHGEYNFIMQPIDLDLDITAPLLLIAQTVPNVADPGNPNPPYGCPAGSTSASCDCCTLPVRGDYCQGC